MSSERKILLKRCKMIWCNMDYSPMIGFCDSGNEALRISLTAEKLVPYEETPCTMAASHNRNRTVRTLRPDFLPWKLYQVTHTEKKQKFLHYETVCVYEEKTSLQV